MNGFSHRVLVLNRLWQAVNIVGVKRAFGLLFQDHARVIHSEEENYHVFDSEEWVEFSMSRTSDNGSSCMRTVRFRVLVPKVLLLSHYDRLPVKEIKFTRRSIFQRDHFVCQYCGRRFADYQLNLDHVIPRDRGGQTSWENVVSSCLRCNARKANRLPHEAGMRLRRKPRRPQWRPFVSVAAGDGVEESWRHFIPVLNHAEG